MTEILFFAGDHSFLAWSARWLLWAPVCIAIEIVKLPARLLRLAVVMARGWPPEHLDAWGDWKPAPKTE